MSPKLFLFAAGAGAADQLETSLNRGYSGELQRTFIESQRVTGVLPEGRIRAWGARRSPGNTAAWSALEPGDIGLAYADGRFRAVGRLAAKAYAPELATQLWGLAADDAYSLMYFLESVEPVELDREAVMTALGYSWRFVPRGLMIPSSERQSEVARHADSAAEVVAEISRRAEATPPREREMMRSHAVESFARDLADMGPGRPWLNAPPPIEEDSPLELPDAYARITSPSAVVAKRPFDLVVGLADTPQGDVGGDQRVRRPAGVAEYELKIEIVAAGFTLPDGESWTNTLPVTPEDPFPAVTLHPTPVEQEEEVKGGLIQVLYLYGDETLGLAVRAIGVAREPQFAGAAIEPDQDPSFGLMLPDAAVDPPADVSAHILRGERDRDLVWILKTSVPGLKPGPRETIDIGDAPAEYLRKIVAGVGQRAQAPDLELYLRSIVTTVGDHVPDALWRLLREAADRKGSRPTLFLRSVDSYVPWELAGMPDPLLDQKAPPSLGAQAVVGRWPLLPKGRPAPAPPKAPVRDITVVSGTYDPPLYEATAEAQHLVSEYKATPVSAVPTEVVKLLDEGARSSVVHFAVHGHYAPGTKGNGLILSDGSVIEPDSVKGAVFPDRPFVFLNACQVGAGEEVLGDYAGMAAAFLYAGASGVVAPLWSVNDGLARTLAEKFYKKVLGGQAPAEFFRDRRASAGSVQHTRTFLAYQFYGHPSFRLERF